MFHLIHLPDGNRQAINLYDITSMSEVVLPDGKRMTQVFMRAGQVWQFPDPGRAIMDGILAAAKGYPDPEDYAETE
jgi:hypothetical protein